MIPSPMELNGTLPIVCIIKENKPNPGSESLFDPQVLSEKARKTVFFGAGGKYAR
jgi:hypothetical protein